MSFRADYSGPCRIHPSPSYNDRRAPVDMLLLHYTGMRSAQGAIDRLCDAEVEASSHYLVDEDGAIVQMVPERYRAWHAGKSIWQGVTDNNSRSVGIEIVNPGHEWGYRDFPQVQIDAVIDLCKDILSRHAIAPAGVLAHSDIAPDRKEDPGERFPWKQLAQAGIGQWIAPDPIVEGEVLEQGSEGPAVADLRSLLADYGYGIDRTGVYDDRTRIVVTAFQRHFRPERVDGRADLSTLGTLRRLLASVAASPVAK